MMNDLEGTIKETEKNLRKRFKGFDFTNLRTMVDGYLGGEDKHRISREVSVERMLKAIGATAATVKKESLVHDLINLANKESYYSNSSEAANLVCSVSSFAKNARNKGLVSDLIDLGERYGPSLHRVHKVISGATAISYRKMGSAVLRSYINLMKKFTSRGKIAEKVSEGIWRFDRDTEKWADVHPAVQATRKFRKYLENQQAVLVPTDEDV